jgi:hypothetical protein
MSLCRASIAPLLCVSLALPNIALAAPPPPPKPGATAQPEPQPQPEQLPDPSTMSADDKLNLAKRLYKEAKGFHDAGDYYNSVIKYEQAYTYAPDKHLFAYNLGVDAWELKDCARVKHYLQTFLLNDDSNDDLRKDAKRILQEAESNPECITQANAAAGGGGGGGGTSTTVEDNEEAPGLDRGNDGGGGEGNGDSKPKKKVSGLLVGGAIMAVLGVGAAGGGAAVLVIGSGKKKELDALSEPGSTTFPTGDYREARDLEASLKSLGLVGPVLLGVGGAMLVGGIALIAMDRGNKKKGKGAYANAGAPRLTGVGASPLPGGGGAAALTLSF